MPARSYGPREGDVEADVQLGTLVRCVYCPEGFVEIDEVDESPDGMGIPEELAAEFWCEGECRSCGRRVEYDYKPWIAP